MRAGLAEVAVTVRVWTSLLAPEEMPERLTVCAPAFSLRVRLPIASSVGGWLTGLTVTVKARLTMLLLAPPSLTVTVIVAEPKALAHGARVERAGGVGAGVGDGGIGDERWVGGSGGDGKGLDFVAGARGDAQEVDGLSASVFVESQVANRIERGRLVHRIDGDSKGAARTLLLAPPSLTLTVMVAEPKALAVGAKVSVPVALGLV